MSRIRPSRFVHVVYRTRQFDEMIAWYQAVLDCKVQYKNPALAFLTYDEEHHRVALINLAAVQPQAAPAEGRGMIGVDHVAYTYDTVEDLLENYAQLKEKGIMPYWCVHHGVTMSMYYADPDGNQMELQVDAYLSGDDANRYMQGPHFETNPIGVEYDPDELLARVRAGTPGSAFLERKNDLPVSPIRGALAH
ncbi:MAG: VOC family protein [Alphaproteobacteria bacterium]|nr:VOC family protein [Alphaproteobacteria bacterium]MBV8412337.1 VOC family protein [Alphaproteobacteria bacterium]